MGKYSALPNNLPPRLVGRSIAAEYVGVCANTFDGLVANGVMPQPKCLGGKRIAWDVRDLDAAINDLPRRNQSSKNDTWGDVDAA